MPFPFASARLNALQTAVRHSHTIVWGGKSNDKKIKNIKYIVAFCGHKSTPYHTTTNQEHMSAAGVRVEKRLGQAGMQGGINPSFFAAEESIE